MGNPVHEWRWKLWRRRSRGGGGEEDVGRKMREKPYKSRFHRHFSFLSLMPPRLSLPQARRFLIPTISSHFENFLDTLDIRTVNTLMLERLLHVLSSISIPEKKIKRQKVFLKKDISIKKTNLFRIILVIVTELFDRY